MSQIAAKPADASVLDRLATRIEASRFADPTLSYTAKMFARGRAKIAQKVGEEATETVIEFIHGDRKAIVCESADLLYHLLLAWVDAGVAPAEVWAELQRREGVSGLVEKASRPKT
jgi:phosphoribosyl-ATP pyrophosphohydrolase